jgi:metal transporter CNNM
MNSIVIVFLSGGLIVVSAICSGLNIALMSLDYSDLKRRAKLGNKDAKKALKFREKAHLSLASILITNIAVISAVSLALSSFLNGLVAGLISTILIVIFGEILPQAFAVKHALRVTSLFSPFMNLIIILSYPISKPLEILLSKIIGPEYERIHTRYELGLLISDHYDRVESELDDDEVEIARSALLLSEKRVRDIMVPISKVFYLLENDVIDADMIDKLTYENRSRIPIFNKSLTRCNSFLLLKDLVDEDFGDNPKKLADIKTHPAKTVGPMTALDTMFRKFIAAKSHLMIVVRGKKIVGIITIEDIIEEIIGKEIEDESDVEKAAQT